MPTIAVIIPVPGLGKLFAETTGEEAEIIESEAYVETYEIRDF